MHLEEDGQSIDDIEDRISLYKNYPKSIMLGRKFNRNRGINKSKNKSLDNKENKLLEIRNDLMKQKNLLITQI